MPRVRTNSVASLPPRLVLMPLHQYDAIINGKAAGKRPLHRNWTTRRYKRSAVIAAAKDDNYNIGVRLTDGVLIIDVDPRNGGDESFVAFIEDFGLASELKTWPCVRTGSGGRHYYLSKPDFLKIGKKLDGYPGLDFLSKGQMVVAPGSVHPNGAYYALDPNTPPLTDALPRCPAVILQQLRQQERARQTVGNGTYSSEQLERILNRIPVEDFSDQAAWFSFMAACHHATSGDGRDVFIDWSTGDPAYSNDDEIIGRRWDSLDSDKANAITSKTLEHIMRKYGLSEMASAPDVPDDEFDNDFNFEGVDDQEELSFEGENWILYDKGELTRMLDEAQALLIATDSGIYQSGGRLVQLVRQRDIDNDESVRRNGDSVILMDITIHRMLEHVIEHCRFMVETEKGLEPCVPTLSFASHMLARQDRWRFPKLNGIIRAPTLRYDGSLLSTPGYDEKSGLLLVTDGVEFPKIPDCPTRQDAIEALEEVNRVIKDFPFPGGSRGPSYAVAVSMIISPLICRSVPAVPGHGVSAPTMATGKTLLADCSSIVATGLPAVAISQGANEEEDEKRLFSMLLKNDSFILMDNILKPVQGAALATIVTQASWQNRYLGQSRVVSVNTNAFFCFTGNNLSFKADMRTRALLCRLDANIERPEERVFKTDLRQYTTKHRAKLVMAGLLILRAFITAKQPGLTQLTPFGRFEEWSNWVRGALVWLGLADPCETRAYIESDDPDRNYLAHMLHALNETFMFEGPITASSIFKMYSEGENSLFDEAIDACVQRVSTRSIGIYLKQNEGKIVDGLRLVGTYDKRNKIWSYIIEPT